MVKSSSFLHTSSHPDKYNNSANRIISKEEEREDIQGEIFQSSSSTVFPHIIHSTRTTVFPHAIQQLQDNSTYRINSTTRNTTTTRLIPCRSIQGIFQ